MRKNIKGSMLSPSKSAPSIEVASIPFVIVVSVATFLCVFLGLTYWLLIKNFHFLTFEQLMSNSFNSVLLYLNIESSGCDWEQWLSTLNKEEMKVFFRVVSCNFIASIFFSFITGKWAYKKTKITAERKISGSDLLIFKSAEQHLNTVLKQSLKESGQGLPIHYNVHIPKELETKGILICGQIGAGKSQLILPLIIDASIKRKAKTVIFDIKGDYSSLFRHHEHVAVLAPWDQNSLVWHIGKDIKNEFEAMQLACALIPDNSGKDLMWVNASRLILVGCCAYLIKTHSENWGWKKLSDLLNLPEEDLHRRLRTVSKKAANLVKPNSKTSQSMMLTMYSFLSMIHDLADIWEDGLNGISLKQWVKENNNISTIILQQNPVFESLSEQLTNLSLNFISKELLSLPDDSSREMFFFLDEASQIEFDIVKFLTTCRSKGGRLIVGIQDLELLIKKFSKEEVNALSSMVGTLIMLRQGAMGQTADNVSSALGEQEIERLNNNFDNEDRCNFSWQRTKLPIVSKADLVNLPQASKESGIVGFMTISGVPIVAKLRWKLTILPKRSEPFTLIDFNQKDKGSDKKNSQNNIEKDLDDAFKKFGDGGGGDA
jgi:type IV secretory pathway TraG/TraD family ATPase VirD4